MSTEQLSLPRLDPFVHEPSVYALPHARRIWVNRSLRLDQAEWIGFDMDYTLAIYKQDEIDRLSIAATVKKLVDRGYPPDLLEVNYDTTFPVRGLFIDKKYGHILKMDRYKFVGKAYHGMRELSREERRSLYHSRRVRTDTGRYHWIDTLYALPEAALYAGAVDLLDRYGTAVDYGQLFVDIRECIDEAHRDGSIVDVIEHNLPRFVDRDRLLPATLHKLRSAGKKLFLLTNSRSRYTHSMMSYLLDGMLPEYPSWKQYFDVVVVAASKPAFFTERRPIMERIGEQLAPAGSLERGRIYEGGNLVDFERMIRCYGDAVLYIGDHIYGDILRSKKESAWRTAMIVQEMEAESTAMESTRSEVQRLESLANRRARLEDELRFRQARLKEILKALDDRGASVENGGNGALAPADESGSVEAVNPEAEETIAAAVESVRARTAQMIASEDTVTLQADRLREKRSIERIRQILREMEEEARTTSRRVDQAFHTYWGSIFKQGNELSSFGDQVEEYACLYTSRVSNFLNYSPLHYFRSPRDLMPHELP